MYLSFYWAISSHLLTVLYQMIPVQVRKYAVLGVIWVLCMVLGWFLNSFLMIW
jgi:hypothetical protein